MSQKVPNDDEILQAAREARSVFAKLDALLRQKEESQSAHASAGGEAGLSAAALMMRSKRNERELSAIFDGESRDGFDSSERQDSTVLLGEENTMSQHPASVLLSSLEPVDDRDLADALKEAQTKPTIHPAFPNTFKVRQAQGAREQANAERAIAASLSPGGGGGGVVRAVRPKTPLNPALIGVAAAAPRPPAPKKYGWPKRGGGGGGGGYAKRPYDAEHAERMRRRAVSGAPKKRRVYSSSGGGARYGGGGMGMMDPEERYAEQREEARSNRDGSDRGGERNARGWKGL